MQMVPEFDDRYQPPSHKLILTFCPECGAGLCLSWEPPLDKVASAVIDHLIHIQDSLREVKRLVEEEAL